MILKLYKLPTHVLGFPEHFERTKYNSAIDKTNYPDQIRSKRSKGMLGNYIRSFAKWYYFEQIICAAPKNCSRYEVATITGICLVHAQCVC